MTVQGYPPAEHTRVRVDGSLFGELLMLDNDDHALILFDKDDGWSGPVWIDFPHHTIALVDKDGIVRDRKVSEMVLTYHDLVARVGGGF